MKTPPRCPKCKEFLRIGEHSDGLPGTMYQQCNDCGYVRAIAHRPRRVHLPEAKKAEG